MSGNTGHARVNEAQWAWVRRVLGVSQAGATTTAPQGLLARFQSASADYASALAIADKQIALLKQVMLASDDPDYEEIAEDHLDGVIGETPRRLLPILQRIGQGGEEAFRAAAAKALPVVTNVLSSVEGNEAAAVCEGNSLGVPVSIRATLSRPMTELQTILQQAATG